MTLLEEVIALVTALEPAALEVVRDLLKGNPRLAQEDAQVAAFDEALKKAKG